MNAVSESALVAPAVGYVLWDPRQASDFATYAATIGCAGLCSGCSSAA